MDNVRPPPIDLTPGDSRGVRRVSMPMVDADDGGLREPGCLLEALLTATEGAPGQPR